MSLKYYYDLMSQPCRALYIFLKMNKIPFEAKPVALRKGEHMKDWYTELNPFQKVPTLDDNGFVLTESIAILRYLAEKHNVPDNWFPRKNLQEQARHDEYLNWQHVNTRLQCAMVFQNLILIPKRTGNPIDWGKVESFTKNSKKVISHLESYFLRDRKYICGDKISVADLLCLCELQQLNACCREKLYEDNVTVNQWMNRVKQEVGKELFNESHIIVHKVREMFQMMQKNDPKL